MKFIYQIVLMFSVLLTLNASEIARNDIENAIASIDVFHHLKAPNEKSDDEQFIYDAIKFNKIPSEILTDYYWASTCKDNYTGIKDWDDKTFFCRSKKFLSLLNLKSKNDHDSRMAYKAIILSERVQNCGSMDNAMKFYDYLQKNSRY